MDDELEKNWNEFVKKHGKAAYGKVDEFLTNLEKEYKHKKIKQYENAGVTHQSAVNKARQSWVAYVGSKLENIIHLVVEPIAKKYNAKVISDKSIKRKNLDLEFDRVRREVIVHFDNNSCIPDADIIVYRYNDKLKKAKIISILSVKNSFRERYTETPYWKLKLNQSPVTKNIQVFMVTPDRDSEISYVKTPPGKARLVLEYELDGVYIAKDKDKFDSSNKVGDLNDLLEDLTKLLKKR